MESRAEQVGHVRMQLLKAFGLSCVAPLINKALGHPLLCTMTGGCV